MVLVLILDATFCHDAPYFSYACLSFSSSSGVHFPFLKLGSNEVIHLFLKSLGFLLPSLHKVPAIKSQLTVSESISFKGTRYNFVNISLSTLSSSGNQVFLEFLLNVFIPNDSVIARASIL